MARRSTQVPESFISTSVLSAIHELENFCPVVLPPRIVEPIARPLSPFRGRAPTPKIRSPASRGRSSSGIHRPVTVLFFDPEAMRSLHEDKTRTRTTVKRTLDGKPGGPKNAFPRYWPAPYDQVPIQVPLVSPQATGSTGSSSLTTSTSSA